MSRRATIATIIGGLVAVAIVGTALVLGRTGGSLAYDEDEQAQQEWCEAVTHELTAGAPTTSFRALAGQVLDGSLRQPDPVDDPADPDALERWQRDHAAYLTSSFVRLLEGWPKELTIEREVLVQSIEAAHNDDDITHPDDLVRAGAAIDRYVARTC